MTQVYTGGAPIYLLATGTAAPDEGFIQVFLAKPAGRHAGAQFRFLAGGDAKNGHGFNSRLTTTLSAWGGIPSEPRSTAEDRRAVAPAYCGGLRLFGHDKMMPHMDTTIEHSPPPSRRVAVGVACLACVTLLSLMSVFSQVKTLGLGWHEEHYRQRLDNVVAGNADSPGQYRPLSDTAVAKLCNLAKAWAGNLPPGTTLGPLDFLRQRPVGTVFVAIRVGQNILIFLLALLFFRRLGISFYLGLLGISALAWAMTHANQDSDLAINTYSEILFYLLAGLAILHGRPVWIPVITVLAAMNRETSVFIPVMLFSSTVRLQPSLKLSRPIVRTSTFAMGLYWGIFFGLRQYFGARGWAVHPSGAHPGVALLFHNLAWPDTWTNLAGTLGLMPVLALIAWRAWPRTLKAFFWAIVPVWFPLHFCFGAMAETRLVLVPLVMVFLPGVLIAVQHWRALAASPREVEA